MTNLSGITEWVVSDPELAKKELERLRKIYVEETELIPQIVPRPIGVTSGGHIEVESGQILVWDDSPSCFLSGFLVEELHHYLQLKESSLLGGENPLTGEQIRKLELEVVPRMRASDFTPFDHRNYEPYTRVPLPPGLERKKS